MVAAAELTINTNASAMQMAQTMFGDGVTVQAASYTGWSQSKGIWTNGDSIADAVTPGDSGVILSTGRVRDITQSWGDANWNTNTSTNTSGPNNHPDFNAAAGANTYDASWLDVDFIPEHDTLTIRFVFASEEYPEYANSIYNDFVGVWINGSYVDPLLAANVDEINNLDNSNLYHDNTGDAFNTEMDGFTVTMSLTIPVNAGVVNSIRIGIADVSDSNYDSNLLIAADSIQSTLVAIDDSATVQVGGQTTVNVLGNDINHTPGTLVVTQINGVNVLPGQSVTLVSGQTVTLNPDMTFTVQADTDLGTVRFTYTVGNGAYGDSDVGFVTLDTVPCFVAGTLIRTPDGERPVEELAPGDLVLTLDDGPQPVRWVGRRQVAATGAHAPVEIAAGTFGPHAAVRLSPLHRVLLRGAWAELLFGADEVLVSARDLVNGCSLRRVEGGTADYVHILFDRHQIVIANGLEAESFLPGPQTADAYEEAMVREICSIFPEFDPVTGTGYPPSARPALRAYEGRLCAGAVAA